jgi:hypothetical protein
MTFASGKPAQVIDGRECGKCSMCCKVVSVDEIGKPPGVWCKECAPGKGGCKIYESRPEPCRHFLCAWLFTEDLGPEWYPANSKMYRVKRAVDVSRFSSTPHIRRVGKKSPTIRRSSSGPNTVFARMCK